MATIKDIARECGVSAMTVSAVLNNKPGEVSAKTRERVLEATVRLKYRPNAVARRMVGKSLKTIGLADRIADPTYWANPYESQIFEGIISAARRHRWDILYFAGHPIEEFNSSLTAYLDGRCDGMIYFSHGLIADEAEQIVETGLPVVLIGANDFGDKPLSVVDVDNIAAAHEAVSYLIELGHQRIAMFQGVGSAGSDQRLAAYRKAHADAGVAVDEHLVIGSEAWEESGYQLALDVLSRQKSERPTAAFCFNDSVAFGVMRAATQLGFNIPVDFSIIGFDDVEPASISQPPLTTVRQPLRRLGERAVDILLGRVTNETPVAYSETLPHELIIRGSTARVRA